MDLAPKAIPANAVLVNGLPDEELVPNDTVVVVRGHVHVYLTEKSGHLPLVRLLLLHIRPFARIHEAV